MKEEDGISGRMQLYVSAKNVSALTQYWRRQNVDLNFSFQDWNQHESVYRHFRHLSPRALINSATFRRLLFPDLFVVGLTSTFVMAFNEDYILPRVDPQDAYVAGNLIELHDMMITLPAIPFTLSSFALGLLVTFRTQSGHARYVQARKDWGAIINVTRDLGSRIVNRVSCEKKRGFGIKLVQSFPYTLMAHLTEDGSEGLKLKLDHTLSNEDVEEAKNKALRKLLEEEVWKDTDEHGRAYLDTLFEPSIKNKPLHVLNELRRMNVVSSAEELTLAGSSPSHTTVADPIISSGLDGRILDLMNALGSCERILRTPIYTSYTRHASRFLTLWCNALPMALYPVVGPEMTVPFSLAIAFIMLGIEDIGIRVEQPFNILPLWQYSGVVKASCDQILEQRERSSA